MDFRVNSIKVRAVAVYVPHCGYSEEEYDTSVEQIKCVLSEARQKQRRIILGGDFNSQLGVGARGATLHELQNSFALKVANECNDPWEE